MTPSKLTRAADDASALRLLEVETEGGVVVLAAAQYDRPGETKGAVEP
jgi:hypothetical protein